MTRSIEESLARSVIYASKALEAWYDTSDEFKAMIAELEKLTTEQGSISPSCGGTSVHITGDKQRLLSVVRILRRNGYATEASPPAPKSTNWCPTYFYTARRTDAFYEKPQYERDELLPLWPPIHFYFTSSVCKMVQVGTEMKEVPIYNIQCGDGSEVTSEELEGQPEGNSMPSDALPEADLAPRPSGAVGISGDEIPF